MYNDVRDGFLGAMMSPSVGSPRGFLDHFKRPDWIPDWIGGSGVGEIGGGAGGAWGGGAGNSGGHGLHPQSPRALNAAAIARRQAMIAAYRARLPRTSATGALVDQAFSGNGRPSLRANEVLALLRAARRGELPGGGVDIPGVGSRGEVALYGLQRNYAGVRDGTMTRRQARRLDRRSARR